jgi:hypothetical protein
MLLMVVGCGPGAVNQDCSSDSDCESNICHAGICGSQQPAEVGNACTGNGECKSYNCQSGKCAAGVTARDAACRSDVECKSQNCENGTCGLNATGLACNGDNECKDKVCYDKKCAKACTKATDCGDKQDCGSDDGKRAFCYDRKYATGVGQSCGAEGSTCPGGLPCIGIKGDAAAVCSPSCRNDLDCPPSLECKATHDGNKACGKRVFCSSCVHDGQCPSGMKCLSHNGASFCTRTCAKDGTECPMYAECKDTGAGAYHCVHKAGSCKTDGKLCAPCTKNADCADGNACVTFQLSFEKYCANTCSSNSSCQAGYKCYKFLETAKYYCGQAGASSYDFPTCKSPVSYIMKEGDVMDDFEMIAYSGLKGEGSVAGKELKVVKLSDFKDSHKIILFNIGAFW